MALRELKIGASGVRGVVGDALTPELIVNFACAFGTWCGGGPVVIGRDTRRSSTAFRAAVVSGLLSTGCRVIDLGVGPSPLVSFAIRELGASGGIAITGSHNDASWNALKFFGPDGALLNAAKNEELLDVYHGAAFELATWDRLKPVDAAPDVERPVPRAPRERPRRRRDPRARASGWPSTSRNGACGAIASRFLESLRCTLLPVNAEPTGEFAHPPAPTAANMRQMADLVRGLRRRPRGGAQRGRRSDRVRHRRRHGALGGVLPAARGRAPAAAQARPRGDEPTRPRAWSRRWPGPTASA